MTKKERIYETKIDKRKTENISIRTTVELATQITEKAKKAGLNRNDYICTACQQCQVIVIPEGQEILQVVQETRNMIRSLQHQGITPISKEVNVLLGKVIIRLRNIISQNH